MDQGLFLMMLFCGFLAFFAIIWCFLSTCLGLQIRRSDFIAAFKLPSNADIQNRDRLRQRDSAAEYELDDLVDDRYDRLGGGLGSGNEAIEMMRRGGPKFY